MKAGTKNRERVREAVEELMPALMRLKNEIHSHPETSLNEHRAAELLCDFLASQGFRVERGLAGLPTSFRADAGKKRSRPRPALLAEYDALPGLGHACGHSIIAAAAAGAGAALHGCFPDMPITVMGTPGEEIGIGKIPMIEAGAFNGIDLSMMVHPSSKRQLVKLSLGVVRRTFTYQGKPAHAAAFPEHGINALDAAVMAYNGIAALRQQVPDQARIHVIITEGGKVPNIIPERAQAVCVVRALDLPVLADLIKKVEACARGAAKASRARLRMDKSGSLVMPLKVNRALVRVYEDQVHALGLKPFHGPEDTNIGSSDIGNLSHLMPVIHPHVPIARPGAVSIHTPEFERAAAGPAGRRAVKEGASLLALTALTVFLDSSLYSAVRNVFEADKENIPPGWV